jgi:O-antigen ligase
MSVAARSADIKGPAAALVLAFTAAGMLVFLATTGSTKVLFGFLAGLTCLVAAYVSGNPRLFCLWGFCLTLPFDLSKRFGTVLAKMGGESAFRIEMSDPFLLGLIAFLARDIWNGHRAGVRIPKVTFVWLSIMLLGVYAFTVGPWRITAAHEVVRMIKLMILFLVICNELDRPSRMLHCSAALAFGVLVQSVVGLIQYYTREHLGLELLGETGSGTLQQLASESVRTDKAFRIGAFLSHPNIFGIFLAALLPMTVGVFLLKVGKTYKVLFLSTIGLGMAALIGTLSRSGWISFAAAFSLLMTLMILHQSLRRRSLLAAGFAAAALLGVCIVFAGPIMTRIFESKQSAMLSRAEYLRDATGLISARPVMGWGLNSYVFAAPAFTRYGAREAREKYGSWLPPVHNIYYLWMAETGVVGLALHLGLLFMIIATGVSNLGVKNELLFTVNAACLCAMLAFLVDGFFSFSLRINQILRVFWVLSGMIMAVRYWRLGHRES